MFRRARALLGSAADAQEVVQDVFVSFYENPDQFAGRSALTTFLYGATTHACLNRLRNQKTRQRLLDQHVGEGIGEGSGARSSEELLMLHRALRSMPEELAQVAVYYCVDGLRHEEIARLLACSRRHVGNLLARVSTWAQAQEDEAC